MADRETGTIRLLFVEDDPDLSVALKTSLEECGVDVTLVEGGEEALEIFNIDKFDAIVSDIRLQRMSGVELLARVREVSREFPVILLTAYDTIQTAIQAVKLGAHDYIVKPMDTVDDVLVPLRRSVNSYWTMVRNRQLEARLRESEARFRALVESSADHIFMLDSSGKFIFSNNRASGPRGEPLTRPLTGLTLAELHTPENARLHCERLGMVLSSDRADVFEYSFTSGDERCFHQVTLYPVRSEGKTIAVGGIARDISEIRRGALELAASRDELRALGARLEKIDDTERQHISRDLHDYIGQLATTISFRMALIQGSLPPRTPLKVHKLLRTAMKTAEEIGTRTRSLMYALRPAVLDDHGLFAALHWLIHEFSRLHNVPVELLGDDLKTPLSPEASLALFRIAQEAVMNSFKHAKATRIVVSLSEKQGIIQLTVKDNGVGFSASRMEHRVEADSKSWGLVIMRERAQAAGGTLSVMSTPGEGTTVSVVLNTNK